MSSRSLKLSPEYIEPVKSALRQHRFPSQKALALELGLSRTTVSSFFNGKPIDFLNFVEISEKLAQDWQTIADNGDRSSASPVEVFGEEDAEAIEREDDVAYIDRPPVEERALQELLKPGGLIRIKACRGMGKTELTIRTLARAKQQPCRTAYLNLLLADGTVLQDLDTFLRWFCASVCRGLRLPNQLKEFWEEGFTSPYNCTVYFEDYLLNKIDDPLVLALDNVEHLFLHPHIASDFFGLLRAWHEKAKIEPIWKKFRLAVIHSTEVYIPLNLNQSPFNVGEGIELPEFSREQVKDLARRQGLDLDDTSIAQLMQMVGGHPSLVQRGISSLNRQDMAIAELLQAAPTEAGIYGDHLRSHLLNLRERPELAAAMQKLIETTASVRVDSLQAYHLQSLGLVHREGNEVRLRCELYRQYFGGTAKQQVQEIQIEIDDDKKKRAVDEALTPDLLEKLRHEKERRNKKKNDSGESASQV